MTRNPFPIFGLAAALVLTCLGFSVSGQAQTLDFQNYNAIIFNNLQTTSDIEGRTFVGNDFIGGNSANLGIHLSSSTSPTDRSFVVGGDLAPGNPINLQRGSLYIGGSTSGRIINYNGGGSTRIDNTLAADLAAIEDYALLQSQLLLDLTANSTVSLPSNQPAPTRFMATAGIDGLAVFNVSGASIFSNPLGQQFELITQSLVTDIVINVSGTSVNWTQGNMVGLFNDNYWQGNIIWNFYEATSLNFGSRNFNGAVLAPLASITTSGNIDGLVVAKNLTTSAEVHLPNSNSPVPNAYDGYTAPIPEPGSLMFIAAAAGYCLILRNRRLWV